MFHLFFYSIFYIDTRVAHTGDAIDTNLIICSMNQEVKMQREKKQNELLMSRSHHLFELSIFLFFSVYSSISIFSLCSRLNPLMQVSLNYKLSRLMYGGALNAAAYTVLRHPDKSTAIEGQFFATFVS